MGQEVFNVKKIAPNTTAIEEGAVRMFLLEGDKEALLVDTGFGTGDVKTLVAGLTDLPLKVLNTHGHVDHLGCNKLFDEIYAHPSEFAKIRQETETTYGKGFTLKPIIEGDIIDLGGRELEVILLPGHAPGSVGLLDRQNRFFITNDNVGTRPVFMFMPEQSIEAYVLTLQKIQKLQESYDVIYASHGELEIGIDCVKALEECAIAVMEGKIQGEETQLYDGRKSNMYKQGDVSIYYK